MTIENLEAIVKTLVMEVGSVHKVLTALHNVSVHGEILDELGFSVDDEQLELLFEGYDESMDALKAMGD